MNFRELLPYDKEEANKIVMDGHQATIWTALPAIITSFDPATLTVEATPSVKGVVTDKNGAKTFVQMPQLVDVPVCYPRGGGYTMTFPIAAGDECLVVFSSRCIDGWWASGKIAPPNDFRMHDLSDGFAIIGPFSQMTKLSNISTSTAQFRSNDGKVSVELDSAGGIVNITAPTKVNINTPVLSVSGEIIAAGDIVSNTSTGRNISSGQHTHQLGNSTTTAPITNT